MAIRSRENVWGAWAFLIGVILAVAVGIVGVLSVGKLHPVVLVVLVVLGFIVGFVNVSDKDVNTFLVAAVSLVIVSFAGIQSSTALASYQLAELEIIGIQVGKIISSTLGALLMLLIPATIVVAIKTLFSISQH